MNLNILFCPESLPPRIEWRVTGGSEVLGRGGEVVVTPGAGLVLDCIFRRSSGTPEWSWHDTARDFPTGWASASPDNDWVYRLELQNVTVEDSGEFRCSSQRGYTNTFLLAVTETQCPGLTIQQGLVRSSLTGASHSIGTLAELSCPPGYNLLGDTAAICREDGEQ